MVHVRPDRAAVCDVIVTLVWWGRMLIMSQTATLVRQATLVEAVAKIDRKKNNNWLSGI